MANRGTHRGNSRNESLLDLFLELQILDRVPRSGYLLRGVPDPEGELTESP